MAATAALVGTGGAVALAAVSAGVTLYQGVSSAMKGEKTSLGEAFHNFSSNTVLFAGVSAAVSIPVVAPFVYAGLTGLGGYAAYKSGKEFVRSVKDPTASNWERAAHGLDTVVSVAGMAFAARGLVKSARSAISNRAASKANAKQTAQNRAVVDGDEAAGKAGADVVGTKYNDIKPTQDFVNPQKVADYAKQLQAGKNCRPSKSLKFPEKEDISLRDITDLLQVNKLVYQLKLE